jgi:hypothetical protein
VADGGLDFNLRRVSEANETSLKVVPNNLRRETSLKVVPNQPLEKVVPNQTQYWK